MQIGNNFHLAFLFVLIVIVISACGSDSASANDPLKVEQENPSAIVTANSEKSSEKEKSEATPDDENNLAETTPDTIIEKEEKVKDIVQEEPLKPKKKARRAKMVFSEPIHDYGFIMQGDKVEHDFTFKNIGNADLLIKNVKASCGCTTPDYSKEPIAPGESGKISVIFNSAGKLGRQIPSVDVFTNYNRKITVKLQGYVDTERAKPVQPKKTLEAEKIDSTKIENGN